MPENFNQQMLQSNINFFQRYPKSIILANFFSFIHFNNSYADSSYGLLLLLRIIIKTSYNLIIYIKTVKTGYNDLDKCS